MLPKAIGSTWLYNYDGKLWPVVLCDDDRLPQAFLRSKRNSYSIPAILLGKLKYIWVAESLLREFDPHKNYLERRLPFENDEVLETDADEAKSEELRRQALKQDALEYRTPAYWKNYIQQRSEARKVERKIYGKRKRLSQGGDEMEFVGSRRSNSTSVESMRKHQKRNSGDNSYLLTPDPTPTSSKGKKCAPSKVSEGAIEVATLDDSDDDDLFVRDSRKNSDPFVSGEDEDDDTEEDRKLRQERDKNHKSVQNDPPSDEFCTIFVGETHTPFSVPLNRVTLFPILSDRMSITEELRNHIFLLEEDINITPNDFIPIRAYLHIREFLPRIIDSGTERRLEDVTSPKQEDKAAQKIAQVYVTASKIQLGALQLLCVDKLKVLHRLPPNVLLTVLLILMKAEEYGCDAESEMQEWLIDYIAELFWKLVRDEGMAFQRLMGEYGELRQRVLEKLAQHPELGRKGMEDE